MACYLCAVACPVDCIALQATEDETGRRYPAWFRINFSRCIFCGFCEEACPTYAIQLTPDVEMCEYERHNMVYEKEDLLIAGPGKYHDYDFYRVAGLAIGGKDKGEARATRPRRSTSDGPAAMTVLFYIAAAVAVVATCWSSRAPTSCTRCCTWWCRCSPWPWSSSRSGRRSWPPSR